MKTFIILGLLLITGITSASNSVKHFGTDELKSDMIFTETGVYTVVEAYVDDIICTTTKFKTPNQTDWDTVGYNCE